MTSSPHSTGQQFVAATVHLAGAVEVETGHRAHYSVEHVQARIGGVLVYFLDAAAVDAFARAVVAAAEYGPAAFAHPNATPLPRALVTSAQEVSLVVRLQGEQTTEPPQAVTAAGSLAHRGHVTCTVGGVRLVLHDAEALHRLAHVTDTVARLAAALWPTPTPDKVETRDRHAERWEAQHAPH